MTISATPAAGDGLPRNLALEIAIEDVLRSAQLLNVVEEAVLVEVKEHLWKGALAQWRVFAMTEEQFVAIHEAMSHVFTSCHRLSRLWNDDDPAEEMDDALATLQAERMKGANDDA